MSRATIRRTIPLILTMVMGILFVVEFYFQTPVLSNSVDMFAKWATIIWGFALPYAVLSVFTDHIQVIIKKEPGKWYFSAWMLFLILLMTGLGLTQGTSGANYQEVFQYMAAPVLSTMTGMLALYAISAGFRSWHARTPESWVMIISGFLAVLGLIAPIGEAIWPGFGTIANYLNDYVWKAERTVFYIATSLGAMLLGYRTLIGQETGYLRLEPGEGGE
jgi:hypothetical protein